MSKLKGPSPTFDDTEPQSEPRGDGAPASPEAAAQAATTDGRRPLGDILEDFRQPIRPRHLDSKPDGDGGELTFCPWYRVARYVDHYTKGHWSKDVEVRTTSRRIFVTVTLTIDAADATVSRSATGTETLFKVEGGEKKPIPYGDPSSNAESMAFRRAAANFGLGLGLYEG